MQTIAIVSQKGGAGKTTLAVNLATEAAKTRVTLIIDTDPQATASRWGAWRGGGDPEVIDCGAPSLLAGKLGKAEELGADLVVIDTPPHADAMARQAAKLADLILNCADTVCTNSASGYASAKLLIYFRFRGEKPRISGNSVRRSAARRSTTLAPQPSRAWRWSTSRPIDQ